MIILSNFSSISWHLKYQEWYITISDSFSFGFLTSPKSRKAACSWNWNQNHPIPIQARGVKDGCSLNPSLQYHILACSELFWFSSNTKQLRIRLSWVIKIEEYRGNFCLWLGTCCYCKNSAYLHWQGCPENGPSLECPIPGNVQG